jgi:hypothetical protein
MSELSDIRAGVNRNQDKESFSINDPEVGRHFAVRDMTEDQLRKYASQCAADHATLTRQAMECLGQATIASKMAAVLQYEMDRRQKSITIATPLEVSRLRQ